MKSLLLGLGVAHASQLKCSVNEDMKIAFTPCSTDGIATAYPYYNKVCQPQKEIDYDTGEVVTDGSEKLPRPFRNYDCSQMVCPQDGMFRTVDFSSLQPRQECKRCPPNSIAIRNGLRLDAKMGDEDHLTSKLSKHFSFSCQMEGYDKQGNAVKLESSLAC